MKLMHISDLHLGKKVNEFSMIEDQRYILTRIQQIVEEQQTDGVLIAGDIYDKAVPPIEAVELLDDFLAKLVKKKQKVFMISGNHDSAERIAFASSLLKHSNVFVSPVYDGKIKPVVLSDEYGEVNFYLLPFVKPVHVRRFYEEEQIENYTDAIRVAIDKMEVDTSKRNILLLHQFVTGATRCESEEKPVGGLDDVNAEVIEGFDYVALGHIHGPQNVGTDKIRYCGTPLKYSFSEINHKKSVTMIEVKEKGSVEVSTIPLEPKRDLYEIRGTYDELTRKSYYEGKAFQTGYLHVTLTDEEDVPEALGKLRAIYPYIMKLEYDNTRTRTCAAVGVTDSVEEKGPRVLFDELYELQNGTAMNEQQGQLIDELIEKIWGGIK